MRWAVLLAGIVVIGMPARAQKKPSIPQQQPDPLARLREAAAASNAQACSATEVSACAEAAPKIVAAAMGASPMADNLRRLTDEIGGRVTGSPAMEKAVAWGVAGFRDAGVDEVHTEKFMVPATWGEGASSLEVTAPSRRSLRAVSAAWSPATPAGGIEATVVDVGQGDDAGFTRAGDTVRDSIVLVHTDVLRTMDDLGNEYARNPGIVARAVAAGATAILWMSTREGLLLYRQMTRFDGSIEKLPQAIVAREDAERLARDLAAGNKARVHLDLPNHIGGPAEQENVVAEIRGRENPEQFVVLGAHLDSWELGTGALDDGCNAALAIEAARDIHATGIRPRRSIRFVLFSGEEQGMLGSRAYVTAHRAELDHAVASIIFDFGSGRVTGFSLGGRPEIEPELREALDPVATWGITKHTADANLGSDNIDFLLEGIPNLVANQDPANLLANYHAASDTYDKVDLLNLKLNTAVAGLLAFSFAELPKTPGPRLSRPQIDALLRQTGLDTQMKTMGFWHDWESGQRGRQP